MAQSTLDSADVFPSPYSSTLGKTFIWSFFRLDRVTLNRWKIKIIRVKMREGGSQKPRHSSSYWFLQRCKCKFQLEMKARIQHLRNTNSFVSRCSFLKEIFNPFPSPPKSQFSKLASTNGSCAWFPVKGVRMNCLHTNLDLIHSQ